jgi:hypothetical protein
MWAEITAAPALAAVADAGLRLLDFVLSLQLFHLKTVVRVKAIRGRHFMS